MSYAFLFWKFLSPDKTDHKHDCGGGSHYTLAGRNGERTRKIKILPDHVPNSEEKNKQRMEEVEKKKKERNSNSNSNSKDDCTIQ